MKTKEIDALLSAAATDNRKKKPGQKCKCCHTPVVRDIIARYFEKMDANEPVPSICFLARQIVQPEYGISEGSVRNHIRNCLRR